MAVDASRFGLGLRSERYAIAFQDGVAEEFLHEENGFSIEASTAACVLAKL
jgi:peroxiredoxin